MYHDQNKSTRTTDSENHCWFKIQWNKLQLQNNGINKDNHKLFTPFSMHIDFNGKELVQKILSFLMSAGEDINLPVRNDRQAF